jgi:XTP/dITP diphosphohydrolase
MQLIFATHNNNKVAEIKPLIPASIKVSTLDEIGIHEEIPETADTIKDNALLKVRFVYQRLKCDCFADDTGLEVDAINGEPGVYSARYAGEGKSANANIEKLLLKLKDANSRSAKFKTVIAAIIDGKEYIFEGIVHGIISEMKMGQNGFGYDPVFVPDGYMVSFAQMTMAEKNSISHRGLAVKKFAQFLNEKN